jgi:predicted acetyltransferase
MTTCRPITLIDARESETNRTWLTNVYPAYLHDLSEFDEGYYHLNEYGLWEPDHLPSWLDEKEDWPLLIVAEGRRVGFALVNQAPSPHIRLDRDFRMSEFFVLRSGRRTGVGQQAAYLVFDRFRGRWELNVLPRNLEAISFWRGVITGYTDGCFTEQLETDAVRFCFRTE